MHFDLMKNSVAALNNKRLAKIWDPGNVKMQTHNCKLQFAVFRENSDGKVLRNLVASSFGEKVADLPLAKASLKRFDRSEPVLIETPYIKNLALVISLPVLVSSVVDSTVVDKSCLQFCDFMYSPVDQ